MEINDKEKERMREFIVLSFALFFLSSDFRVMIEIQRNERKKEEGEMSKTSKSIEKKLCKFRSIKNGSRCFRIHIYRCIERVDQKKKP